MAGIAEWRPVSRDLQYPALLESQRAGNFALPYS
jgi:hypothetical protein